MSLSPPNQIIPDAVKIMTFYRALESERPDALFTDPYARLLAGEHAATIINSMPQGQRNGWTISIRTKVFDDMILQMVAQGVDTILQLGAGLDTRPYRLNLPSTLRWIEVDHPEILAYKAEKLHHVIPQCRLEQQAINIMDRASRQAFLSQIASQNTNILVITEGLLVYLTELQAVELAVDLHSNPNFHWWLLSLSSPYLLRQRTQTWGKQLSTSTISPKFAPEQGGWFFQAYGWQVKEARFTLSEARRLQRPMPQTLLKRLWHQLTLKEQRELARKQGGYILLEQIAQENRNSSNP